MWIRCMWRDVVLSFRLLPSRSELVYMAFDLGRKTHPHHTTHPPPPPHTLPLPHKRKNANRVQLPETCFYSSYALMVKESGKEKEGARVQINDYVELTEYPALQVF